jgi:hypothetical protein
VIAPQRRRSKYGARRSEYAGEVYDSRGEAEYARTLDLRKAAGAIRDWRRGTSWMLLESPTGRKRDGIEYIPDFHVWDAQGDFYVLDFKGVLTREFRLKAKLWRAVYPAIPLVIVKANGEERRV